MKVLRRIYGPTKQKDGTRQIKSNEELNRLTGNKNIINCIKTQRLAWFRNVHHMPGNSMVKKVYECSPAITRSLGRPKNRWEDDIKRDVTRMKITNWKDCIRNRTKWKTLVEKAKTSLKLQRLRSKKKKKKACIVAKHQYWLWGPDIPLFSGKWDSFLEVKLLQREAGCCATSAWSLE